MHRPSCAHGTITKMDIKGRFGYAVKRGKRLHVDMHERKRCPYVVSRNGIRVPCTAHRREAVFRWRSFQRNSKKEQEGDKWQEQKD